MVEPGPRHYPCLDGLRGLAILLVIPHNTDITVPVLHGPFAVFAVLIDRGWVGVQLFFVLSGFLITEQLCRSRHAPNYLGGFYARRVLRIVPLYAAAVAAGGGTHEGVGEPRPRRGAHPRLGPMAWDSGH
jgi:peptidoglycan/LPS O-acetylase OafA/YrhL